LESENSPLHSARPGAIFGSADQIDRNLSKSGDGANITFSGRCNGRLVSIIETPRREFMKDYRLFFRAKVDFTFILISSSISLY
jgi:hypothetical protein